MLADLEQAGYIILGIKSYFYKDEIIVVGYCCNGKGQYSEKLKIVKIVYWRDYKDVIST